MSRSSVNPARFFDRIIPRLRREYVRWREPSVTALSRNKRDPFKVLLSTIISLRTKDDVTHHASERLFALASTPEAMLRLPAATIAKAIYPAGFYATKSRTILGICRRLIAEFHGKVPSDLDVLLTFKGVGRKTANLVLTRGFGKPGICVDTHVHRISNRLGILKTRTPEETEFRLREILPRRYWIIYNDLLVAFGQNQCKPVSPLCSSCVIRPDCARVNVTTSR